VDDADVDLEVAPAVPDDVVDDFEDAPSVVGGGDVAVVVPFLAS
jgi:hypothetical protein